MKRGVVVVAALGAMLASAPASAAAISVTRAELKDGRLRAEGAGANPVATVQIDDGAATAFPDSAGNWRVEKSPFRSPTCVITVTDGQSTVQAPLSGCTATAPPPPPPPAAPSLVAPAAGASVTQPVTLQWSQVTDPAGPIVGYDWEVATSSTFGASIRAWGTVVGTQGAFSGLADGTYYWHVRSIRQGNFGSSYEKSDWSAPRTLIVRGSAAGTPAPPTLTHPASDKQYHPWEYFDYEWNAVSGAARYVIEYDDEPNFDWPIWNTSAEVPGPRANGGYGWEAGWIYWRVRSVNADGVRSLPSAVRRVGIFYTAPLPPPPTLLAPAQGETISFPYTFDWSDVENAQPGGYTIEIDNEPTFGGGIATADWTAWTGPQSYFQWDSLAAGTWYWRVLSCHGHAAPDASACTAWSAVKSFVVPAAAPALVSTGVSRPSVYSGQNAGPDRLYGWVQLSSPAPAGGAVVQLDVSDRAAVAAPSSVTVAAGEATAFFDMDPLQVLVDTPVTLTATYDGKAATVSFVVKPPDLKRLDIGVGVPAHQVFPAGSSTTVTAILNGRAPAGTVVDFSSSSPDVVVSPTAVSVAEGWSSAAANVTTSRVAASVTATLTATWKGQSVSALITIHPPPTLVSPASGTSFASGSPVVFDWADLDGISYWIQVDDSPAFTAPLFVDVSPSRTSSYQTSTLPVGTLYWRVQTLDMYGNRGDWSQTRSLTITGTTAPPATPALQFPADSARFSPGQTVTFDWSDVSGATSYELQIDDSSTFGAPFVLDQIGIAKSQFSTSTLPTKTMWWRVRARNATGASAWTSARRVEVKN